MIQGFDSEAVARLAWRQGSILGASLAQLAREHDSRHARNLLGAGPYAMLGSENHLRQRHEGSDAPETHGSLQRVAEQGAVYDAGPCYTGSATCSSKQMPDRSYRTPVLRDLPHVEETKCPSN